MKRISIFLVVCFVSIFSSLSFASTYYIGNKATVILRDAPSEQANTVAELAANTPVEELKSNLQNGYSYIQTEKGDKGWIQTQYLIQLSEQKEGFWEKLWKGAHFWKHLHPAAASINQVQPITRPWVDPDHSSEAISQLEQQVQQLQNQVVDLQQQMKQIHRSGGSFLWGMLVTLIAVFLGYLFGFWYRGRKERWFK